MAVNPANHPMGHLFPSADKWRQIDAMDLDAWLAAYPRPLVAVPPMSHGKTSVRWWRDPTLGEADKGDVAVKNTSHRNTFCQVLKVIP